MSPTQVMAAYVVAALVVVVAPGPDNIQPHALHRE